MNLNQQQQIESYLSGQMSPEDASLFEAQVEVNPELRQEMNFQTEVIRGISEYRKIQLKTRLDAINVSANWWTTLQYSTLGQYIGGAIVVALIGGGVYWWADKWSDDTANVNSAETEIPVTIEEIEPEVGMIPEAEVADEQEPLLANDKKSADEPTKDTSTEKSKTAPTKKFNPNVKVPSAGNVNEEKAFNPDELPVPAESTSEDVKAKSLEVEIVDTKSTRIRYRYYGGKLFLYGNFTHEPYEILEINSAKGRNIYLFHLRAYYEILPSDKPVGVQEITDQKLIQELSILRKAK
jgi:hypothetical protein